VIKPTKSSHPHSKVCIHEALQYLCYEYKLDRNDVKSMNLFEISNKSMFESEFTKAVFMDYALKVYCVETKNYIVLSPVHDCKRYYSSGGKELGFSYLYLRYLEIIYLLFIEFYSEVDRNGQLYFKKF
jgi:hypothetical protein